MAQQYVAWFRDLRMTDVNEVGGKNASLGEMISQLAQSGVRVPGGFATTAFAFREFLKHNNLEERIETVLSTLDIEDVNALVRVGSQIRRWLIDAPFQPALNEAIAAAYKQMLTEAGSDISVAVRSSATAEDLPDASFAGQQETYLNIHGLDNILTAVKHVFASLYNDRAISYRVHKGFVHSEAALSAGIQRMVRSDIGAAGVMFTLDTESGFKDVVFITSSYGLGETVVQGAVNPDEIYVSKVCLKNKRPAILRRSIGSKAIKMVFSDAREAGKSTVTLDVAEKERNCFSISDAEAEDLARYAMIIEQHYQRPMDIEWGRDGGDGKLYILQARPETVKSQGKQEKYSRYRLLEKGELLATGRAIGQKIGVGTVRIIFDSSEMDQVQPGDILVTDMTDPNWEPVMKRASAIVTNRGGRTCHAAIIARELGVPAIVGCGNATDLLKAGSQVTVSCAEGDTGNIYRGNLKFEILNLALDKLPDLPVKIMMNVGNPQLAFDFQGIPNHGIGLARLEFIISAMIGMHPRAALDYPNLSDDLRKEVETRCIGYANPKTFYVDKLTEGIATLAAAFYPKKVIVRLSDFKSNEYRNLIGGSVYEPHEENPMIGFRGAARYIAASFADCFELELTALKKVRDDMGLTNVEIMVPFVRTLNEADRTLDILKKHGLERGRNGLRIIMMCEVPSNAILADEFLKRFDGFSIGSNDMTQLTLALDRDSGLVADSFDERDPAVKQMLRMAIQACRKANKYAGICGQGPSDHPDFAKWLMDEGIETISLNPDTVVETWIYLGRELGLTKTP